MRTIAVAALSVAVMAGPGALAARRPPDTPPPGASSKPPKDKRKKPPATRPPWLRQTDAVCRDGLRERKAVLEEARATPAKSPRATLMRILQGFVRVEGGMLAALDRVQPPQGSAAALSDAVARFRARRAEDVALLTRLRRRWNADLFEAQMRRDRAANRRLARLWASLGSGGCARYFRAAQGR